MDTRKCSDSFLTNSMLQGEEDPWKKAKEYKDSIITKESMFEYYSSLLDAEIDQESVCTKLQKEEYDPEEDSIWESLL